MNDSQLILTIFAAMALGTPLIFATVGEIITERAGILNLGVQGTMLVGAVSGFWATFETGSLLLGVVVSMIAGALFSMIHAFASITLRVSQIVSGLALTIFGAGLASFLGKAGSDPLVGEPSRAQFLPLLRAGTGLADLPVVGPVIFGHVILSYVAWRVAGAARY